MGLGLSLVIFATNILSKVSARLDSDGDQSNKQHDTAGFGSDFNLLQMTGEEGIQQKIVSLINNVFPVRMSLNVLFCPTSNLKISFISGLFLCTAVMRRVFFKLLIGLHDLARGML